MLNFAARTVLIDGMCMQQRVMMRFLIYIAIGVMLGVYLEELLPLVTGTRKLSLVRRVSEIWSPGNAVRAFERHARGLTCASHSLFGSRVCSFPHRRQWWPRLAALPASIW